MEVLKGHFGHVPAADDDAGCYAYRHDDEADAEYGIYLADDLIDRQQSCEEVVDEYYDEPEIRVERVGRELGQEHGRAGHEHRTYEHEQHDGEDAHDRLHLVAEVHADDFGDAGTVVAQGDHAGQVVVHGAGENSTDDDPEEYDRAPQSAGDSAEYRAEAGDVQQLDHEYLPRGQRYVVDAVFVGDGRGRLVGRLEYGFNKFAVDHKPDDQYEQADKKCNHKKHLF